MMQTKYKSQVDLLLRVLPEVAKEKCFALHGGTAINLFVRDMPRLSVDIDLTYIPIEDRETSLYNISQALERIKKSVESIVKAKVEHKKDIGKLIISISDAQIKVEVNLIQRGLLSGAEILTLCEKAQNNFEVFSVMPIVPMGQLFGGKICAALDRQHPRDIFDVKYLLRNEGFSDEIKTGFLLRLISHERPMSEVLKPVLKDQRSAMMNQFVGMTSDEFTYEEYESVRNELIETIHAHLNTNDRNFILSVKNINPDWSVYNFQKFPAVKWKLNNLQKLKADNASKYMASLNQLKWVLG